MAVAGWALALIIGCGVYARAWRTSTSLWTHALQLEPGDQEAWISLAAARTSAGDAQGAESAYEMVLTMNDNHHDARQNLALLLLGQGNLPRARALLTRVVEESPGHASASASLGAVLDLQGHADEASRIFKRGLAQHPRHTGLLRNHAQFQQRHQPPGQPR